MKIHFSIFAFNVCLMGCVLASGEQSLSSEGMAYMRATQQPLYNYSSYKNEEAVESKRQVLLEQKFEEEFPNEYAVWCKACRVIIYGECEDKKLPSIPCEISSEGKAAVEAQLKAKGYIYWREFHAYNAELYDQVKALQEDVLIIGATPGGSVWSGAMNFDCWKLKQASYPPADYPCVTTGCLESPHIYFADISNPEKTTAEEHPYLHQKHQFGGYFHVNFNDKNSIEVFRLKTKDKKFKQIIFDVNVFCWTDPDVFPLFFNVLTELLVSDDIIYIPTYASGCSIRGQKKNESKPFCDILQVKDLSAQHGLQTSPIGGAHVFDHSIFSLMMSVHGTFDDTQFESTMTAYRIPQR